MDSARSRSSSSADKRPKEQRESSSRMKALKDEQNDKDSVTITKTFHNIFFCSTQGRKAVNVGLKVRVPIQMENEALLGPETVWEENEEAWLWV